MADQLGTRRVKPGEKVECGNRARGADGRGFRVSGQRDEDRGAVMALGDSRSDDADDARMPALTGEHVGSGRTARGDLRLSLEADPRLDVAAFRVEVIELVGQHSRALGILRQQQLERAVRTLEASRSVEPRGEAKREYPLIQPQRIDLGDPHQRAQTGSGGRRECAQTGANEAAVLADQRHHIGNRRDRHELELFRPLPLVQPGGSAQRLRELRGDRRGAEVDAGISTQSRMHDRRVGQQPIGARRVVVADEDVHAGGPRGSHLLDRRDRTVGSYQQLRAPRGETLDVRRREPVTVADAIRQVPVDVGAERAERTDEDRRRADAVAVVVAVHGDDRARSDMAENELDR